MNELLNRATDCLAHVEHFTRKLGGIHNLARKLTKRSAGCRTANLTIDEAAWCSWAMGVVVNLRLAIVDEGLQAIKQRAAVRNGFKAYAEAMAAACPASIEVEDRPKGVDQNGFMAYEPGDLLIRIKRGQSKSKSRQGGRKRHTSKEMKQQANRNGRGR